MERTPPRLVPLLAKALIEPVGLGPYPGWTMNAPHPRSASLHQARFSTRQRMCEEAQERNVVVRWLRRLRLDVDVQSDFGWSLLMTGAYEPNEMSFLFETLSRGMVMVDAGANTGAFSLLAARAVGRHGRVIAVEPSARELSSLRRNRALNRAGNVEVVEAALGARSGRASLSVADDTHAGHNTLGRFVYEGVEELRREEVEVQTLDRLAEELRLERLDFLKIDVEGAEPDVLEGGAESISRWRPTLLVEINAATLAEQGHTDSELLRQLDRLGYEVASFAESTGRPSVAAPLSANVVGVPRPR